VCQPAHSMVGLWDNSAWLAEPKATVVHWVVTMFVNMLHTVGLQFCECISLRP
jgi:hypothetical protein